MALGALVVLVVEGAMVHVAARHVKLQLRRHNLVMDDGLVLQAWVVANVFVLALLKVLADLIDFG